VYQSSFVRCASQVGLSGPSRPRPPITSDIAKQLNQMTLTLVRCMREDGHDVPDPVPDADGLLPPPDPPSNLQPGTTEFDRFIADFQTCAAAGPLGGGGVIQITPAP
jgi:hypothetical protein